MPIQPRDFFKLGTKPLRGGVFGQRSVLDERYPTDQVPVSEPFQPYADPTSFEPYTPPQQQAQASPVSRVMEPEQRLQGLYQLANSNPEMASNPYVQQYLRSQSQALRYAPKPDRDEYEYRVAQMSPEALKRYKSAVQQNVPPVEAFAQENYAYNQEQAKAKGPERDLYEDDVAKRGITTLKKYRELAAQMPRSEAYATIVEEELGAAKALKEQEKIAENEQTIESVKTSWAPLLETIGSLEASPSQKRSSELAIAKSQQDLVKRGLIKPDQVEVPFYTADGAELVPAPLKKKIESMAKPTDEEKQNWLKDNQVPTQDDGSYLDSDWKKAFRGVQTQRLDALREQGNVDPYFTPDGNKAERPNQDPDLSKIKSLDDLRALGYKSGDLIPVPGQPGKFKKMP